MDNNLLIYREATLSIKHAILQTRYRAAENANVETKDSITMRYNYGLWKLYKVCQMPPTPCPASVPAIIFLCFLVNYDMMRSYIMAGLIERDWVTATICSQAE